MTPTSAEAPAGRPNRWQIPIGAVLVHVCIGSVYAWSTFNRPIQALFPDAPWWFSPPYTTFTTALALLGLSAAFGGPWVERRGPRDAATAAALFFGTGLMIGGLGLAVRQSVLVFLGMGVIGGIGCGLGYISPVSTLIKWFPDRPGMATGMAIMGFGGGAFIASPLSVWLMGKFTTPTHIGVMETFIVMGCIYFCFMMVGATIVRVPPPGWAPEGYVAPKAASKLITRNDVFVYDALKTPQFWLIWWVLCLNVTAGIGVLGQASAMSQEMFPGKITPIAAAGFVGLMSLFNMGGRFVWASTSDYIGRRNTYFVFMVLGFFLYCA